METEFSRYIEASAVLERCGIPREELTAEKAELYEQLAQVNREIRRFRAFGNSARPRTSNPKQAHNHAMWADIALIHAGR